MSEMAIKTMITGIVILLVIITVALMLFNFFPELSTKILESFGMVTHSLEEGRTNTLEAHNTFVKNLDACNGGKYNLHSTDSCFCFTSVFGRLTEDSYLYLINKVDSLEITAISQNGEPLAQTTEDYNLGLMINKDNLEIGCIYPTEYYLKGIDEEESDILGSIGNNFVYLFWEDERVNKGWLDEGDDYTFKFYREGNEEDHPELAPTSILYRIDSTHYCLVTDLIETAISTTDSDSYKFISKINTFDEVKTFLLNENNYCNKQ